MNPTLNMDIDHDSPVDAHISGPLGELRDRLTHDNAVISIVGLGYVGLPIAIAYASQGIRTNGIDLDPERVHQLNAGISFIQDVKSEDVKKTVDDKHFEAFDNFDCLAESDVIYICVPTPVTPHKDPDTRFITSATESIARHLHAGQLIILKSTTFPNTTEELVLPILESQAQQVDLVLE